MKVHLLIASTIILLAGGVAAEEDRYPKAKVSFDDFKGLVAAVESHRASRLVDLDTFLKMSEKPGVIILDARSTFRYERIHVKGARHLSFSDFTQSSLASVIPSFDTTILIYCNNNFQGDQIDFMSKLGSGRPSSSVLEFLDLPMPPLAGLRAPMSADFYFRLGSVGRQFQQSAGPLMLALNIPTYINLYGYGYRDIYELNELVDVTDPRIAFEGSRITPTRAAAD